MRLLAIDPGEDAGWSYWDGPVLLYCGLGLWPWPGVSLDVLVTEIPEIYQGPAKKARDENIITLALNAGRRVERVLAGARVSEIYGVRPKTWKGSADKDAHHRAMKTIAPATAAIAEARMHAECIPKGKQHNVLDAVWLGAWAAPRAKAGLLRAATDYVFRPLT